MRKILLMSCLLMMSVALAAFAAPQRRAWPTVDQQLKKDRVEPGSALDQLIQQNQEFKMLRPEEASDKIPVPLWLRVYWRKAHPEVAYTAADPTGGYPHVLKEVYEWMVTPQDLRPGAADEPKAPFLEADT